MYEVSPISTASLALHEVSTGSLVVSLDESRIIIGWGEGRLRYDYVSTRGVKEGDKKGKEMNILISVVSLHSSPSYSSKLH